MSQLERDEAEMNRRLLRRLCFTWGATLASIPAWSAHPLVAGFAIGICAGHNLASLVHTVHHMPGGSVRWRWHALGLLPFGFSSQTWWKVKHSGSHHRYLNNLDYDDDVMKYARLFPEVPTRRAYRMQPFYYPITAPFVYLAFAFAATHAAVASQSTIRGVGAPVPRARVITEVFLPPAIWICAGVLAGRPATVVAVIGASAIGTGLFLCLVFAPTHTTPGIGLIETDARVPTPRITQAVMSVDYAVNSRLVTWMTGGLNLHIEHHLHPSVPSWRLRELVTPTRTWAQACGIARHEYPTYRAAMRAWWMNLIRLRSATDGDGASASGGDRSAVSRGPGRAGVTR